MKKTKIIATVGPASEDPQTIENMITQGVDVFRFNLKHNSLEWHKKMIGLVKTTAKKLEMNVATLVDLQGPELRVDTENNQDFEIRADEVFLFSLLFIEGRKCLKIKQKEFFKKIRRGDDIYVDNGQIKLKVLDKTGETVSVVAERDGVVTDRSGVNVPGRDLGLEMLTSRDIEGLGLIKQMKVDLVALSFVRKQKDIDKLRKMLLRRGSEAGIVAKIENASALKNLEGLIDSSDGIIVARGDLGVEVPLEQLVFWQKKIIKDCRKAGKPVFVATQMLASMVNNIHPSRAEVSDVSNAVFDGTDGLMLSEETAIGRFPTRAVREMSIIAKFCEDNHQHKPVDRITTNPADTLVEAVWRMVENNDEFKIAAVVVFTKSGRTARMVSSYRLKVPIVAITDSQAVFKRMALSYGIIPYLKKFGRDKFDIDGPAFDELMDRGYLKKDSKVVVIHGNNWLSQDATSSISIKTL